MNPEQWQQILQGKTYNGSGLTFLNSYGNVAVATNRRGDAVFIGPTGDVLPTPLNINGQQLTEGAIKAGRISDNDLANEAVKLSSYINTNYIKNPNGTWRAATYGGEGSDYPTKGLAATNTPTATPNPAATTASQTNNNSLKTATVPNSTTTQTGLPDGYTITGQEPSGWATGPDGHFVKISDVSTGVGTGTGTGGTIGTGTDSGTGGTTGTGITGDPAAQRAALQAAGIDPNLLSDSQVSALYMMQTYTDLQAKNDKQIAPASLSQADMDQFLSQAKAEFGPYYAEQFDIAKNNLIQATGVLTGDNNYAEQQLATQFPQQNAAAAAQAAEAGLARSSIRQQAEQRLKEQQKGLVESGRRKAQSDIYQLGSTFEQTYGADKLRQAGVPQLQSQGFSGLGIAPTTIGYNPAGIKLGTMGAQQTTAELQEQQRLATLEASKRLNNAYGSTATNLP